MMPELRWIRPRLNEKATSKALGMLSAVERERYGGSPAAQRSRFLAGRLILRRLASEMMGQRPREIEIVAVCPDCGGPHGRPTVAGSGLHLSLAHAPHAIVAAASWDTPVGVDVESLAAPSAEVLAAIGVVAGEASILHWTRVEALLKADGRGLRVDPARVLIREVKGRVEGSVDDSPTRYRLSEVQLAPDVRVSVAVAG